MLSEIKRYGETFALEKSPLPVHTSCTREFSSFLSVHLSQTHELRVIMLWSHINPCGGCCVVKTGNREKYWTECIRHSIT